jgi:phospholipid/cholesterol/gamma-HCH transport system substrate-binding protein
MKISNETKVGALTSIIIVLLILGFNFLKGKSLFKTGEFLYADFDETKGIMISNPVFVNGFQVGSVYEINNTDLTLKKLGLV